MQPQDVGIQTTFVHISENLQDIVYSNVYQHISSLFHASAFVFNGIKSVNFEMTESLQNQKIISLSMVQFEFWF